MSFSFVIYARPFAGYFLATHKLNKLTPVRTFNIEIL